MKWINKVWPEWNELTWFQRMFGKKGHGFIVSIIFIILILLFMCSCELTVTGPPDRIIFDDGDSLLIDVAYSPNDYACVITALGQWMEYWDRVQYRRLMDSTGDIINAQHMAYYAMPKDTQATLTPDSSILDNPPQTCLADFVKTSWYINRCSHGATVTGNVLTGIEDYLKYKGDYYKVTQTLFKDWDSYVRVIDQGRPVYLLVAIGHGAHALCGMGYVKSDSSYLVYESFGGRIKKHMWNAKCVSEDWVMICGTDFQLNYK